jgi:hypothetical protein
MAEFFLTVATLWAFGSLRIIGYRQGSWSVKFLFLFRFLPFGPPVVNKTYIR